MKLFFTEHPPTYETYAFPYQVWAFQDDIDEREEFLNVGFLPTRFKLRLWYLARSTRIDVTQFELSSENRRVIKNTGDFEFEVIPRSNGKDLDTILTLSTEYVTKNIPAEFSENAIRRIFSKQNCAYVVLAKKDGALVGAAPLLKAGKSLFYWYGFYLDEHSKSGLGMRLMLEAILFAQSNQHNYVYLGTAYSKASFYKTNIEGFEFFNGFGWSSSKEELTYLITRENNTGDLFKDETYWTRFFSSPDLMSRIKTITSHSHE